MKILIAQMGATQYEILAATSLIRGLRDKHKDPSIDWLVDDVNKPVLQYVKKVKNVFDPSDLTDANIQWDLLVNLTSKFQQKEMHYLPVQKKIGFWTDHHADEMDLFYEVENGFRENNMSLFQFFYRLADMRWKGQGYDFGYFPKTKSRKNRAGIGVANDNLRHYVTDNLDLRSMKLWYIPYKKNVFKRMDEINRCVKIVTDDMLTLHIAIGLRKFVYYLQTIPPRYRIEFFGKGITYNVPVSLVS